MAAPPAPTYIFRLHNAQVNALKFINNGQWIASGDGDGVVALWDLKTRRSIASWKAHQDGILELHHIDNILISHARDHKLFAWDITPIQAASKGMPDIISLDNGRPTLLHTLEVNALNFCKSSILPVDDDVLVAVPHVLTSEAVDIFSLKSGHRLHADIGRVKDFKSGLVMAVHVWKATTDNLSLLIAFESGHISCHSLQVASSEWTLDWRIKPHTEAVLAIAISPDYQTAITAAADGLVKRIDLSSDDATIPVIGSNADSERILATSSSLNTAIAALDVRGDGRIFAGGGWDGKVRIWKADPKSASGFSTLKALAVLKYHRDSVYAVAFAPFKDTSKHYIITSGKEGRIVLWDIY